jgi:DNA-binding response OmpR family regulator
MDKTERCKVLVIHNDPQWGELFQLILNKRDDEITFASDGQQGLDIVERDQPDLVFVYLWTPKLNAFEFYERFRRLPTHFEIPVVFYGAASTERMNAQIQPLGVAGYICQPFSPDELIEARDTVLRGNVYYVIKEF